MIKRIVVLEERVDSIAGRGDSAASRVPDAALRGGALDSGPWIEAGRVAGHRTGRRSRCVRSAARVSMEAERETIDRVLDHTHWNRKQAARLLERLLQDAAPEDQGVRPGRVGARPGAQIARRRWKRAGQKWPPGSPGASPRALSAAPGRRGGGRSSPRRRGCGKRPHPCAKSSPAPLFVAYHGSRP